jgi:hypothetical protein
LNILRVIGRPLTRISYVKQAILGGADLRAFKERPTPRLIAGVALITLSMLLGWPAVAMAGCFAAQEKNAWVFFIGGPGVYAFSWVIWGVAMLVGGADALRYANLFIRWMVRRVVEWLIGPEGKQDLIQASPDGVPKERDP